MTVELPEELKKAEKVIVRFKSIPINYELEELGLKPNTIREEATLDEERKLKLRYFNKGQDNLFVTIQNSETGEVFERKVTDVSYWKGWFIISWNPNASFLETARKELDKTMEDRIISFEKVSRGQKLNPQIYDTYLMFIRHLKELRKDFNAVFRVGK